jgi:hypothetical protein
MSEIIIVGVKPKLEVLLTSGLYNYATNGDSQPILEDFDRQKALCKIDDNGQVEYLNDYLAYDTVRFANNLRDRFGVFWIDQSDLLEYNYFAVREDIAFEEFLSRIDILLSEVELEVKNRDRSQYLWNRLTPHQKARVLPKGYIKNYLFSRKGKEQNEIDLLELFEDSKKGRISFGIVVG